MPRPELKRDRNGKLLRNANNLYYLGLFHHAWWIATDKQMFKSNIYELWDGLVELAQMIFRLVCYLFVKTLFYPAMLMVTVYKRRLESYEYVEHAQKINEWSEQGLCLVFGLTGYITIFKLHLFQTKELPVTFRAITVTSFFGLVTLNILVGMIARFYYWPSKKNLPDKEKKNSNYTPPKKR